MSTHEKMARSERAKQFMPFAALKGYPEALRRTEEETLRIYGEGHAAETSDGQRKEADSRQ